MWSLYLDDCRPIPDGYVGARSMAEAITLIRRLGWPVKMSLDHDLGPLEGPTLVDAPSGFEFCVWIWGRAHLNTLPPCEYFVHSANPVGTAKMYELLAKLN